MAMALFRFGLTALLVAGVAALANVGIAYAGTFDHIDILNLVWQLTTPLLGGVTLGAASAVVIVGH
jgi:hypothetical protein